MDPVKCSFCGGVTLEPCTSLVEAEQSAELCTSLVEAEQSAKLGTHPCVSYRYAKATMPKMHATIKPKATPEKSDGSFTGYYKIPEGATDLIDLIEHKNMSFGVGNIFKACYRLGEKDGTDATYDLRKIIFFAQRTLAQIEKGTTNG